MHREGLILLILTSILAPESAPQRSMRWTSVTAELQRIAAAHPTATLGLAATDVDTGVSITINADQWFPMASTYKVPIAAVVLEKVARGELTLSQLVPLRPVDLRPGSDLALTLQHPGAAFSLANMIDLSLAASDNAAADRVLALAGGGAQVTSRLRALGIRDMSVDRSTLQVLLAFAGATGALDDDAFTFRRYRELTDVPAERNRAAALAAAADRRDSATPAAMTELLSRIARGDLLPKEQTDFLLTTMARARGSSRIRAFLPPGTPRAPVKSGTLLEAGVLFVNDVGILRLPAGRRVALSVFVKGQDMSLDDCERLIGHVARTIFDAFVFDT